MRSRPLTKRSTSGPRKLKCHKAGLRMISSQGPIPGSGASIRPPAHDAIRISRGESVAHHVADIMGDKVGFPDPELVEHTRNIASLGFLVIAVLGMRREAHAPQVRNDDSVIMH